MAKVATIGGMARICNDEGFWPGMTSPLRGCVVAAQFMIHCVRIHKSVRNIMSVKKLKKVRYSKKGRIKKTVNSGISEKIRPRYRDTVMSGADPLPSKDTGQRVTNARIDSAGRLLVPAPFRKALEVQAGDEVNLMLKNGVLEVRSLNVAIREAQALVRRHVSKRKSLVKELIKDRRQEAGRE